MVRVSVIYLLSILVGLGARLPIYIEDSHSGSFGFFAQQLDLDKEYTLLLIDKHSDASGIAGSDKIRKSLREVKSIGERKSVIDGHRNSGIIQPFNWIEPLMPRPITKVIWVAGEQLDIDQIDKLQKEASTQLDWKAEVNLRESGDLGNRFQVVNWTGIPEINHPVIVSVDLDYFTDLDDPIAKLNEMWKKLIHIPNLKAVSFALSRPWQKSDSQAEQLIHHAFKLSFAVSNTDIHYEPFLTDLVDRSEKAKNYYKQSQLPPRFDIKSASPALKELILHNSSRVTVSHNTLKWKNLLAEWDESLPKAKLIIHDKHQSIDKVWRLNKDGIDDLWVSSPSLDQNTVKKVNWWIIEPEKATYDIIIHTRLGKGFSGDATSYITMQKRLVATTHDLALSSDTWSKNLHTKHQLGIVKLQAEVHTTTGSFTTPITEIRVRQHEGFRGALEEQLGSAYVFGIGSMRNQWSATTGPETLVGNDCANFLVYAWRQQGVMLPWCNPKQLKSFLHPVDKNNITPQQVEDGIVVHLGSHVAALWKDLGVKGKVDSDDLLLHHLSGYPESISIEEFTANKTFQCYQLAPPKETISLAIGGDLCLAGNLSKPLLSNKILEQLNSVDFAVANLECVITDDHTEKKEKRFSYLIPPEKANLLTHFDLLSLGNNHIGDAGKPGLRDTEKFLTKHDIHSIGAGPLKDAVEVEVFEIKGKKVGFLAFNTIESNSFLATKQSPGTASYPHHKKEIEHAISNTEVDYLVALPHWGDEYTAEVNAEQREIAKWLVDQGADIVVGSHPHHLQITEYYQGKCIIYSLGNFIFAPQKQQGFNDHFLALIQISTLPEEAELISVEIKKVE